MTSANPEPPADFPERRPAIGLRLATRADSAAISAIYNHEVTHSTATFDLVPRTLDEQRAWLADRSGAFAAIVATDGEGKVVFLNPVAERVTGWSEAEARGQSIAEVFPIFHEKTGAPAENPIERVLRERVVVGLANHTVLRPAPDSRRHGEPSVDS